MVRLYYYPHAPYSRKALFAAYEKGIEFERALTPPFDAEAKKRLKTAAPDATVPYLELGDGRGFGDSSLIVEYLDLLPQLSPHLASSASPRFVPADPVQALEIRAKDRAADALLASTAYLAWACRKPDGTRNEEKILTTRASVDRALARLDRDLDRRAFLAGDELTLADVGPLAAVASLLADGSIEGLEGHARLERWFGALTARASWQKIVEECRTVPLPFG